MFGLFLLLHMNTDLLIVFLADTIWLESDSDFGHSVGRDGASGGHIGEGRAGVCIIDTSGHFHQSEVDLKVAHISNLHHTLRIFIQQNTSHRH